MTGCGRRRDDRYSKKLGSYRRGHIAEFAAAAYLTGLGYRVVARRHKTAAGEIDLIIIKARRVGFVEVKQRPTMADCEAAITPRLRQRVRRAAELWLANNALYHGYDLGFDLVFIAPWSWPIYLKDAL